METATQSKSKLGQLTIADGLFMLIVLVAALFRFVDLGKIPLSHNEAELAWSVWRFWQPGAEQLTVSSPAYFSLTGLLTQVFGFSDTAVRLVPALFGLGVVCLPWLIRRQIGTITALVSCVFLAISPLNVIISRTVGGETIAIFAVLLLAVSYVRYRATAVTFWFYLMAAAVGLGLASAPVFYSGFLALAITWSLFRIFSIPLFNREFNQPDAPTNRNALIVGLATFMVFGTFILWYPAGFGASAQIFGDWISQFGGDNGRLLTEPFLAIIRYEPALVILGGGAIIWAIWRSHPLGLACTYWFSAVLLLMLIQTGVMSTAVLSTLPGYLLIGLVSEIILKRHIDYPDVRAGVAAGLFLVFILVFVNTARYLRVMVFNPRDVQYILVIVMSFVLAAAVLFLLVTVDTTAVAQGAYVALLTMFFFNTWGTSWWLSHEAANDPRERWVAEATDDDIHLLVDNLQTLSRQYTNSVDELDIASNVNTPVLRWYLRDFFNAQIGDTLPAEATNRVLITPLETGAALGSDYSGTDFRLSRNESSPPAIPTTLADWVNILRWWLFHDSNITIPNEQIILWVRADLTQ